MCLSPTGIEMLSKLKKQHESSQLLSIICENIFIARDAQGVDCSTENDSKRIPRLRLRHERNVRDVTCL